MAGADVWGMGFGVFDLGDLGLVARRAKCCRASLRWVAWVRGLVGLVVGRADLVCFALERLG